MKFIKLSFLVLATLFVTSCKSKTKKTNPQANGTAQVNAAVAADKANPQDLSQYETAYFASGCFWCVEAIFESVKGVKEVISGYAGGKEKNPTYQMVGSGQSTHAEAVEVYYDPNEISLPTLVQVFFGSHDPTTLNRQGPDRGTQYRSIAFYKNRKEKESIEGYIQALQNQDVYNGAPITTQVIPFTKFYKAEEYHQDYERKHPNNSYIINVSIPRLNRFKENFSDLVKENTH